ncbi:hypothetical protein Cco03nite_49780 [Catellatospora coxensis]|uniref:HTH cro/C1-type domain-containing protein n=1 Tax=Catellatospora coxensis TaxID=310354 RepID=A0A8J3KY27_9ACTN|nr:hypothetical protein Cco03nite_49780 [Catellatospora coxensis]
MFGDRLRALRRSAGLTMEQLAEASGVSSRAISDMERGYSRAPQARTLAALADGLRVTGDDRAVLMAAAEQARSPSAAGRPRLGDLPRGVTDFVGRAEELAIVRKAAKLASSGDGPPPVVVVHGQPGLGKTAFAVRAAEELGDSFPDGRLYVDLRGVDPSPVAVGEVLLRLLRALDVSAGRIATGDDDRSAQLRTLLRDRRCLLVLDNARSEDQVRPLLPAGGRCLVIVTSRRALGGLEGVLRIELPLLAGFESAGLLSAIAAQAADPAVADQVQTLSRLCGHLPLALRIAGTRLAGRPQWTVENMIARLAGADRRLAALAAGDTGVGTAFALSYAQLPAPAATLFRRLAHVPGADFAAPLAAVLTETTPADAEDHLDELVEFGLLQPEGVDRYRFHDLIRLFADERLRTDESPETRDAAIERMTTWLLETAIVAGRWYDPDYAALPDGWAGLVPLTSLEEAGAWLRAETDNWLQALRVAAAQGSHQLVVDAVRAMGYYSDETRPWSGWIEVLKLSSTAAAALPDRWQLVGHINNYAWALMACGGRAGESAEVAMQGYRLAEEVGNLQAQGLAMQFAATAWRNLGRLDDALRAHREAYQLSDRAGNHIGYLWQSVAYAYTLQMADRYDEAIDTCRQTLVEVDRRPVPPRQALITRSRALTAMTIAHCALEQWAECLHTGTLALPLVTEIKQPEDLGRIHIAMGRARAALDHTAQARTDLARGVELLEANVAPGNTLDMGYLAQARQTLADLG